MSVPSQQKLVRAARSVRRASMLSMNEIRAMAHSCAMTRDFVACLVAEVEAAHDAKTTIEPRQMMDWLTAHIPQLNLEAVQQELPQ